METEEQLIAATAQANQALAASGQSDMVWGHASLRDPAGNGVWMKAAGWSFGEVTEDRVALVSPAGEVLAGNGPRHIEYPIHTEVMLARPDVGCVVHTHAPAACAFAALDQPLLALSHDGVEFAEPQLGRFTRTGSLISSADLGKALADAIGDGNGALLPQTRPGHRRPRSRPGGHARGPAGPGLPGPAPGAGGRGDQDLVRPGRDRAGRRPRSGRNPSTTPVTPTSAGWPPRYPYDPGHEGDHGRRRRPGLRQRSAVGRAGARFPRTPRPRRHREHPRHHPRRDAGAPRRHRGHRAGLPGGQHRRRGGRRPASRGGGPHRPPAAVDDRPRPPQDLR